jgi:adenine specific DNA methylase Mod
MPDSVRWGPDNPHPLSQLRTELVWDGKYDEYGNRRSVDIAGSAMPMQKIETVDMPRSEALASGQTTLGELKTTRQDDFRNMLIWGDNKLVMASLLKDYRGKIDLIYIDPPFDVGADFTMQVPVGDENENVNKDQSLLEMVAYRDMWGKGSDSYLHMMFERITLMRDLLKDEGSIYIHCDMRVNSSLRLIMDEVFGNELFCNDIRWIRSLPHNDPNQFGRSSDTILYYTKSENKIFNTIFMPQKEESVEAHYKKDENGRMFLPCFPLSTRWKRS